MSIAHKNSYRRRNGSGELVVFEAARYFSGGGENSCLRNSSSVFPHSDGGRFSAAAARMSLDMAAIDATNLSAIQKQHLTREKKKYKQPSSPGGRLGSFLNSLFNQANSKKKKKSKTTAAADHEDEDDDRRTHDRRRSSISHIRITTSSASNYHDPNSPFSAAVTPPSFGKTPTKSPYGDLKVFSDRQKANSLHRNGDDVAEIEQFRFNDESFRNLTAKCTAGDEDKRKFEKFNDGDDGEDSDSSSDLFDLPNFDFYSRDLPVYGTTDMGRIRIGAPTATV